MKQTIKQTTKDIWPNKKQSNKTAASNQPTNNHSNRSEQRAKQTKIDDQPTHIINQTMETNIQMKKIHTIQEQQLTKQRQHAN